MFVTPSIKYQISHLLENGIKEIDLSEFPFGKVREALEELGYYCSKLKDWINKESLDYKLPIINQETNEATGYVLTGSFYRGYCKIKKDETSTQ